MASDVLEHAKQATAVDLTDVQANMLFKTTAYYNGHPAEDPTTGKEYRLGETRPPGLRALCEYPRHKVHGPALREHIDELQESDIIREDPPHILRTEMPYALTRRGRMFVDEAFDDVWPDVTAPGDERVETTSVLRGEQNESLVHRYGVYLARRMYPKEPQLYPQFEGHRPDVSGIISEGIRTKHMSVEVITANNHDWGQILDKYEWFVESETPVLWLFPDSTLAARILSVLDRRAMYCDIVNAPFDRPGNFRINRLQEYCQREASHCPAITRIETYASLFHELEGDETAD